ncbi:MAG: MFS transporter [Proteobacteria bacterium]|nr:MFS transporter [Pseudomonadota bacterium]
MARDIRLFYLFRLLATSYLWVPVSVLFPLSRGLGFDQVMILSAIYSAVVILVEVPTGALADRIGRRHSMLAGALAMVASGIVAYLAHSFLGFAVAYGLAAISMALCSGADSAYLFDLLQERGRGHEYPRRESAASASHQIGSALACAAGGLIGEIDLALPYLVTAAVAFAAFIVALCLRSERRPPARTQSVSEEMRVYMRHMARSVRDVAHSRRLAWIVAYSAVVFVLVRSTEYLYQPYLDERGFAVSEIGFIFAGSFLLASFMAHRAHAMRRWLGEDTLIYGLLGMLAVSFLLLNLLHGAWAPLSMLAVQAVAIGLYSPLVKTMLNRQITDSNRRATILSVESIARRGAKGVFSPIAGYVGVSSAIYLCGGIGIIGFALLALFAARSMPLLGRLPTDQPSEGDTL